MLGQWGDIKKKDPISPRYYILEWTEDPFTLHDQVVCYEYTSPQIFDAGQLFCHDKFWNQLQNNYS